jgi:hypothetical protein
MFHFPAFPPHTLYIQVEVTGHISSRVTPFGNPRITARLPTPRGLSQAPTSFIGSWCQGIHRAPLKTLPTQHATQNCTDTKMLTSTVQFSSYGQKQPTPHAHPQHPKAPEAVRQEGRNPHPPHTRNTHPKTRTPTMQQMPEKATPTRNHKFPVCPLPQDPTACQDHHPPESPFHPTLPKKKPAY